MNKIEVIQSDYLRASRTIETTRISNGTKSILNYVYNYEGYHFRLFNDTIELIDFFESNIEPELSFDTELELDNYLENRQID